MRVQLLAMFVLTIFSSACQQGWLAGPCYEGHEEQVAKEMKTKDDNNYIAQDPTVFRDCEETFICLSTQGSLPYCTKRCTKDEECLNDRGIEMECIIVTEFDPLACRAPNNNFCAEGASEFEACCERDPVTHAAIEPAKYCAAKPGQIDHDPDAEKVGEAEGS